MTDQQLYLAIGVPSFVVLVGMLINGLLFIGLNSRMTGLETALGSRMASLESRMLNLENTFTTRFDLLMGKIADLDTRIGVLEDRSKRS